MRHFIAYHNAHGMGYSSTALSRPKVKTRRPVAGLEGITVWLIAGEGRSPKEYYLATKFTAKNCETDKYPGTTHPHEISGDGIAFKLSKPLTGTALLDAIKLHSNNFRNGLHELKSAEILKGLTAL